MNGVGRVDQDKTPALGDAAISVGNKTMCGQIHVTYYGFQMGCDVVRVQFSAGNDKSQQRLGRHDDGQGGVLLMVETYYMRLI